MRLLTNCEIIELWESAGSLHPIDRALTVLQTVLPTHSCEELAALPLGSRDALLLALRSSTFGDLLVCKSNCHHCGEMMELECSCTALLAEKKEPRQKNITEQGYEITLRPLDSFDLAAAAVEKSLQGAQCILMDRCVAEVSFKGSTIAFDKLPENVLKNIADAASTVDSYAEILLTLCCSGCGEHSHRLLDIAHILWLELSNKARRLLMEVHLLAKAYGWVETDILKLSVARRAAYLQLVAT